MEHFEGAGNDIVGVFVGSRAHGFGDQVLIFWCEVDGHSAPCGYCRKGTGDKALGLHLTLR
jgi:hypothetical protein